VNGACIACDATGPFEPFYAKHGFTMVRCPRCRLVFQHPQAGEEALAESYYHDEEFTRLLRNELREIMRQRAQQHLRFLADAGVHPRGTLLDVGASSGAFVSAARDAGWQSVGVELGAATAAEARVNGLDVRTGTLADAAPSFPPASLSAITFWDVLEHLRDPRDELALAHEMLRPGGVLAATMPNVEGWYPRITRRLIARRTGHWEYPELPVHLFDFSPRTLRLLLERGGFTQVRVRTFATPFWYYRATALSPDVLGRSWKGRVLRAGFELLRVPIYPLAQLAGRGNAQFVVASRP
jgi:2-polyprenyl-3-methyl-5-hydroxy-6-metoxy-1,4-benzoquinol methylase